MAFADHYYYLLGETAVFLCHSLPKLHIAKMFYFNNNTKNARPICVWTASIISNVK